MEIKLKSESSMRWRVIHGDVYADIRDMQLLLRSMECSSENAKTAFRVLADALREWESKVLEK